MLTSKISSGVLNAYALCGRNVSAFSGAGLTSEKFMKKTENEPVLTYKRGSVERVALEKAIVDMQSSVVDIPVRIGNEKIFNNLEEKQVMPCDHQKVLARFTHATSEQINEAIRVAMDAKQSWERKTVRERADVLLHAADLCAGKYRMKLNAATMLGQAKSIVQAEIDSACELIDFFRFNAMFTLNLGGYQPISTNTVTNSMVLRSLEGFVAAIAPFNFTAIGGNLATAPTLLGNVVLWKPSSTATLSNYVIYEILEEAGMPPGVISFLPSDGPVYGNAITESPHLSAINFTGSVPTFKFLWKKVAENIDRYVSFPRLVGECGGKNFHLIHKSADLDTAAACTILAAFEYQGQKCSACSRLYVSASVWPALKERLIAIQKQLKVGDVRDGSIFMSAVIDARSFKNIATYIDYAKSGADGAQIIFGGTYDDSKGYFVQPTLVQVDKWDSKLLTEEIFGPVLTAYVYEDNDLMNVVSNIKEATQFGLTGAIFSQDKDFLNKARDILRNAVGNMYLNDKCTGAVVGQQPFGGARMSGTNDKAGGPHYPLKWTSPQCIKQTITPQTGWKYPAME